MVEHLTIKGKRALMAILLTHSTQLGILPARVVFLIFDVQIMPILLYGFGAFKKTNILKDYAYMHAIHFYQLV